MTNESFPQVNVVVPLLLSLREQLVPSLPSSPEQEITNAMASIILIAGVIIISAFLIYPPLYKHNIHFFLAKTTNSLTFYLAKDCI